MADAPRVAIPEGHEATANGLGFVAKMRRWICMSCGRTVSCPALYYAQPNTTCTCCMPHRVTEMIEVQRRAEETP